MEMAVITIMAINPMIATSKKNPMMIRAFLIATPLLLPRDAASRKSFYARLPFAAISNSLRSSAFTRIGI